MGWEAFALSLQEKTKGFLIKPGSAYRKKRPRRRTCADGGDTYREIQRKIVCEALAAECAVLR